MEQKLPDRLIACIDMRSFYVSCVAMLEGLDVLKESIAVVGDKNRPGSVVLSASPPLKEKFGISTKNRLFELPDHPDIYIFEPKMSFFLDMSMAITQLIAQFVPRESIHIYSIDENFINLTGTERLWGKAEDTLKAIQRAIYNQFRIPSCVGMGPNMLISKLALDLEAKKTGFARWTYEDIKTKLWPVRPLSKMWGIGVQMEKNLNNMGIFSVKDLANADLNALESRFGVMGNQLYYHAWGIDFSDFGEPLVKGQISFGKGQMLMRDYCTREEICVPLLEMCNEVTRRARAAGYEGRTISLGLSYSRTAMTKSFYRSKTIAEPTNQTMAVYEVCKELLDTYFVGEPARQLSVRLSNVEKTRSIQLDLFDDGKEKRQILDHTVDNIRDKFGSTSILRAVSYTPAGTALKREQLVGGHFA